MRSYLLGTLILGILWTTPSLSFSNIYQLDTAPLLAEPELAARYKALQDKFQIESLTSSEHKLRMSLLKSILLKHPDWLDGYWLRAADAFFLGSSYTDPKEHALARSVLIEGEQAVNECLARDKNQLLCKFFKASVQAKIASIDGILASLRRGKVVRDIWLEVIKSQVDITFRPNVSLQGSANYGLGLFYRLVPNFFLMDWMFSIRGNIDESIRYHREALKLSAENPCYRLMLAVSLFCKIKGEPNTADYREGMQLLEFKVSQGPTDLAQTVCVNDMPKIKAHPEHTCGYTQAKYQDEVKEKDLNK